MQSSLSSGRTAEVTDPFTGQTQVSEVDDPLTDDERNAVLRVLRAHGAEAPDEYGYYTPSFSDGSSVEAGFKGLVDDPNFTGGMISLHGSSEAITEFLFMIADAGNFVMQPIMDGNPEIVTKQATADAVAERFPDVLIAQSSAAIATIISSGVDAWEKYRRKVT